MCTTLPGPTGPLVFTQEFVPCVPSASKQEGLDQSVSDLLEHFICDITVIWASGVSAFWSFYFPHLPRISRKNETNRDHSLSVPPLSLFQVLTSQPVCLPVCLTD